MGFDFERYNSILHRQNKDTETKTGINKPLRFIYAGTIDRLRQMDIVLEGFHKADGAYELHIYSSIDEQQRGDLHIPNDPRFYYHTPLPRNDLLREIARSDIGVSLIPPVRLYLGSSPTKTYEYAACGTVPLINYIPEYKEIFNNNNAFFCKFDQDHISYTISEICKYQLIEINSRGTESYKVINSKRNYRNMSSSFYLFIKNIVNK